MSKAGIPLSELRQPFDRYAASGEINTEVEEPAAVIEAVAEYFAAEHPEASQARLDGSDGRLRGLVVQRAAVQHRAPGAAQCRGADRASCDAHTDEVLALIRGQS